VKKKQAKPEKKVRLHHRFSFFLTFWWLVLLLTLGVGLLLFAEKDSRQSAEENRMLQGFPSLTTETLLSGQFMSEFESFLSDGMFARKEIVSSSARLMQYFSRITTEEIITMGVDAEMSEQLYAAVPEETTGEEPAVPEEALPAAEATSAPQTSAEETADSKPVVENGHYALRLQRTDGGYDDLITYTPEDISRFLVGLRYVRDALGEDGTVHVGLVYTAAYANSWLLNTDTYCGWESTVEDYLTSVAPEGVYFHNAAAILEPHMAAGEYIFYRTDHHWTPLAAGIFCQAVMEAQGYPAAGYGEYAYKRYEGFLGSVYKTNPTDGIRAMADDLDLIYPNGPVRSFVVNAYGETEMAYNDYNGFRYDDILFGRQTPWRRFVTGNYTGRSALIISDSFGTAFASYLVAYYDEVHMVDYRNDFFSAEMAGGTSRELIARYGIDDVYVILSGNSGIGNPYAGEYLTRYFKP